MLIDLHIRDDILENFPNYEYFNCKRPELLDFTVLHNLVGQQQEAFITYHILKQLTEHKDVGMCGLDIGCGQNIHFACIGCNDYYGSEHPIYKGKYFPQITSQAEDIHNKINQDTLGFIVISHILEHVKDPITTFRNWCKLLRKDGVMILIMPDARYEIFGWDPSHITYWSPEDFKNNCIIPNADIIKCEEIDSFKNKFSFNALLRRI